MLIGNILIKDWDNYCRDFYGYEEYNSNSFTTGWFGRIHIALAYPDHFSLRFHHVPEFEDAYNKMYGIYFSSFNSMREAQNNVDEFLEKFAKLKILL